MPLHRSMARRITLLASLGLTLSLLPTLLAVPAQAGELHQLTAIDQQVTIFTGHSLGETGGARTNVDRKLKLAQCRMPLALEWYGTQHSAVRVTCPDPSGWRIFVPLIEVATKITTPVVRRRDALRVEAGGTGFRVARQGEALEDGRVGEVIRIRINDGSRRGRIIAAQVVEPGRARIPLN